MYARRLTRFNKMRRYVFYRGTFDDIKNNVAYAADTLKTQSNDAINLSVESALDRSIQILKMTEERIKTEKLNNTEITVGLNIGPIQISISSKIHIE